MHRTISGLVGGALGGLLVLFASSAGTAFAAGGKLVIADVVPADRRLGDGIRRRVRPDQGRMPGGAGARRLRRGAGPGAGHGLGAGLPDRVGRHDSRGREVLQRRGARRGRGRRRAEPRARGGRAGAGVLPQGRRVRRRDRGHDGAHHHPGPRASCCRCAWRRPTPEFSPLRHMRASRSIRSEPAPDRSPSSSTFPSRPCASSANAGYWGGDVQLEAAEVRFVPDGGVRATQVQTGEAHVSRIIPVSTLEKTEDGRGRERDGHRDGAHQRAVPQQQAAALRQRERAQGGAERHRYRRSDRGHHL